MRGIPAAAALLLAAATARADVTASSEFGFEGAAVPGAVAPIRVELASSEKTPVRVRVEVAPSRTLGTGVDGIVNAAEVYLAPGARKRITLPVLPRVGAGGDWTLTLTAERRTFLRHGTAYADGRVLTVPVGTGGSSGVFGFAEPAPPVIAVLGDPNRRSAWLGDEARYQPGTAQEPPREAALRAAARLTNQQGIPEIHPEGVPGAALPQVVFVPPEAAPDTWLCYEGFDAILWIDPDPDALGDPARVEALLEYAACGGRLVVAWTPGSKVPASSPLARALPAEGSGHDDLPAAEVLAALGEADSRDRAPVPVARLARKEGTAAVPLPDGRPLLVSRGYGLGTVAVAAFDPRLLPGAGAPGHARLLALLLGSAAEVPPAGTEGSPYFGWGIEPLLNHLRRRFLSTPPLGLLVLGLLLYVAAIGPLDYFLLKRKGRLRRTVVTFPLIVIGFTGLAYGSSFLLFGGSSGQARVAWLDLATAPGRDADVVRGLDVLGAYSPAGTTLPVASDLPRSFLSAPWIGGGFFWIPEGSGLEGTVAWGPDGRPQGAFDLPLRSYRTVQTRFSGEVPLSLDARRGSAGGTPFLTLRNGMQRPIRDLCVVRGDRAIFPGDLAPGGIARVDLADGAWVRVGGDPRLPDPCAAADGFFSRGSGRGPFSRFGSDQFVPDSGTEEASAAARLLMARAAMGVSLAGIAASAPVQTARALARQGIDLSRPLKEGRILVLGWCDGDPLGVLPAGRNLRSSVVVVRRVLPAEEGP